MSVGWGEWVVIAVLVLLLFGPKRLPELARSIGRSLRQFQHGLQDLKDEIKKDPDVSKHPKEE
ncbi:MAG: twin-arginine translocase TatA/TatE family subunit [Deltaproteobacteria bacterium]|nr:twin-arginine translocase TatA/TatE family subunit [Deltaproteobacteria bacterium]